LHRDTAPPAELPIQGLRVLNLVPIAVVPISTGTAALIPYTTAAFACAGFVAVAAYLIGLSVFLRLLPAAGRFTFRPGKARFSKGWRSG
jgi:hypothetical protein